MGCAKNDSRVEIGDIITVNGIYIDREESELKQWEVISTDPLEVKSITGMPSVGKFIKVS